MTWPIAVPKMNFQVETHKSSVMESLELRLVGHQSGSGLCAACQSRECSATKVAVTYVWTTVVRQLHQLHITAEEESHSSLPVLAVVNLSISTVVRDLNGANSASDTRCSPVGLFLSLVCMWTVHLSDGIP